MGAIEESDQLPGVVETVQGLARFALICGDVFCGWLLGSYICYFVV